MQEKEAGKRDRRKRWEKEAGKSRVGQTFFCVLYKRTWRSLHSFTFFMKECGTLCVLLRSL